MSGDIAVALCTYNGATYLGEQLASLTRQTRPADRLVIRDDRSTDGTWQQLRDFARDAPFEVDVSRNRQRLGAAANFAACLGDTAAEWVFPCDQDDIWSPVKIETMLAAVSPTSSLAGFSDARLIDGEGTSTGPSLWNAIGFRPTHDPVRLLRRLLRSNVASGMTMAVHRELIDMALPLPPLWVHDAWLAGLAAGQARLHVVEEPLVQYRVHGGNAIGFDQARGRRLFAGLGAHGSRDAARARTLRELANRLADHDAPMVALEEVNAAVGFHEARAALPRRRMHRVPHVVRLARHGAYRRYGRGVRHAVWDTVRRYG